MKNDNLNITFSIGKYMITILKFTYECQTWNTPSHSHSSNSYELHYIPQGKGTLISSQKSYADPISNISSIPTLPIPLMNTAFI